MLFNSFEFLIFLPLVFLGYWFVFKSLKIQNLFVVAVSYLFYGWWDWRFLLLIAFTTVCSFASGILLERFEGRRKRQKWVCVSNLVLNLVILGIFKYFNFFGENFATLFRQFGYDPGWVTLHVVLPVGISFYTFQALSYTVDVYRGRLKATHDVVAFFAFVSFFPQLVAGPIERAVNLLPQFTRPRTFDYEQAVDGIRQMLWGFFKKVVIADNCAVWANGIFDHYETMNGSGLLLGAFFFTIQIYGDFSGYSDIAIGCARLFGIQLMRNFNFPYFSRDIAEFWRRWHISLTTWFRDYIYIPLGGSRCGKWKNVRNVFIVFLVSGFWHGADWTFILWGAYHALLFLPLLLLKKNKKYKGNIAENRFFPTGGEWGRMTGTFVLVMMGWIIFRAESVASAFLYIRRIFVPSLFAKPNTELVDLYLTDALRILALVFLMFSVEWWQRNEQHALAHIRYRAVRWSFYGLLVVCLFLFIGKVETFIYFQF